MNVGWKSKAMDMDGEKNDRCDNITKFYQQQTHWG